MESYTVNELMISDLLLKRSKVIEISGIYQVKENDEQPTKIGNARKVTPVNC